MAFVRYQGRQRGGIRLAAVLLILTGLPGATMAERGAPWVMHVIDNSLSGADGVRLADVNGDGLLDIATGWEEGGFVRAYINPGFHASKNPWPAVTVGAVTDAEDAVFVDLDGDGAMDVVSSAEGGTRGLFVSWAPSNPADYLIEGAWQPAVKIPASAGRLWMFAVPMDVDGPNGIDIVAGGKDTTDTEGVIAWFECSTSDRRNLAAWNMHKMSDVSWTMSLIPYDADQDGDLDVIVTDRYNYSPIFKEGARWLENPGVSSGKQTGRWDSWLIGAQTKNPMLSVMSDLDGNGMDELVVPTFVGGLSYFKPGSNVRQPWLESTIAQPPNAGTPKGCNVGDIDLDGRPDIVISFANTPDGNSGVLWLSYPNAPTDPVWIDHEISGSVGYKNDIVALVDLDGDGDLDVITTEEEWPPDSRGLGVIWYENPARSAPVSPSGDFDNDGDVDLTDFALFQICFNGPNFAPGPKCAVNADFDGDHDVDLADFAAFQACFNGPNRPPAG